jgi:hypothetical protein
MQQNFDGEITLKSSHLEEWTEKNYDNIDMDLSETGYEDGRWMKLAWNQVKWWSLESSGI